MVNELPLCSLPRTENPAPIIGPNMNPREKATPTNACIKSISLLNNYMTIHIDGEWH